MATLPHATSTTSPASSSIASSGRWNRSLRGVAVPVAADVADNGWVSQRLAVDAGRDGGGERRLPDLRLQGAQRGGRRLGSLARCESAENVPYPGPSEAPNGRATSKERPAMGPKKRGGVTPTIV